MPLETRWFRQLWQRAAGTVQAAHTNFAWQPESTDSVVGALQRWADERPDDPFLLFEGRRWTIAAFDRAVNRHARAWREIGIAAGEVVALVLGNRPAFLAHFYGLAKLGAVPSLINPKLRGPALVHALASCGPRAVLVGDAELPALLELAPEQWSVPASRLFVDAELVELVEPVEPVELVQPVEPVEPTQPVEPVEPVEPTQPTERASNLGPSLPRWHERVAGQSPLPLASASDRPLAEIGAYIYTSGTTGLPKPAIVGRHRLRRAGDVFAGIARLGPDDCLYCCLPLYHANATIIAVPMAIRRRCRLALARRFSARRFWDDCRAAEATAFMYIGELCRYLLQQPPHASDREHQVRTIVGNGLRDDVWAPFVERFAIDRVVEFYAATEGNAETVNLFNRRTTVGPLLPWKMQLARWDAARGEFARDAKGFAIPARPGEPGLLLGKIAADNPYAGYTDAKASRAKVRRDLFRPGDAWFDTGDLLRRDRLWHLHFVDRLGDTFRWQGENVSTQEVAEQLNGAPGIRESTVYGVTIPGRDGRAGMAAVITEANFSPEALYAHLDAHLPSYAQPRFIRIVDELATTGTFKHRKLELREQGWDLDPDKAADPIWVRDAPGQRYVPLTPEHRTAILNGEVVF